MKTNFLITALAPLLALGCDHNSQSPGAQSSDTSDAASMSSYDSNEDQRLSRSEFDAAVTDAGYFSDWDADGDGELTDLEYQTGMYNAWDTDGDQIVDEYEFRDATEVWYPGTEFVYSDWDADGNAELTYAEFQTGLTSTGLYSDWDADGDGELVDREYTTALFEAWDTNGDEVVDTYEYRF